MLIQVCNKKEEQSIKNYFKTLKIEKRNVKREKENMLKV